MHLFLLKISKIKNDKFDFLSSSAFATPQVIEDGATVVLHGQRVGPVVLRCSLNHCGDEGEQYQQHNQIDGGGGRRRHFWRVRKMYGM